MREEDRRGSERKGERNKRIKRQKVRKTVNLNVIKQLQSI